MAEATADITAATTTAVSGAASPRPSGIRRRAISSSEPLRKKTSAPRTSAGTMSRDRTRTGHTRAESRPNAPAPQAAVNAVLVMVSPSSDWSWKSGRAPTSTSMVRVETAQTAITRIRALPAVRHFPSPTPVHPTPSPFPGPVRPGPALQLFTASLPVSGFGDRPKGRREATGAHRLVPAAHPVAGHAAGTRRRGDRTRAG